MSICRLLALFCYFLSDLRQCFVADGEDIDVGNGEVAESLAGRDHLRAQTFERKGMMEVGCHIALTN